MAGEPFFNIIFRRLFDGLKDQAPQLIIEEIWDAYVDKKKQKIKEEEEEIEKQRKETLKNKTQPFCPTEKATIGWISFGERKHWIKKETSHFLLENITTQSFCPTGKKTTGWISFEGNTYYIGKVNIRADVEAIMQENEALWNDQRKRLEATCEKAKNDLDAVICNLIEDKVEGLEKYLKEITDYFKSQHVKEKMKQKMLDEIEAQTSTFSECLDKYNKELMKSVTSQEKLIKLQNTNENEQVEKLQKGLKDSKEVLELIKKGFDSVSAEQSKLVQDKLDEKMEAWKKELDEAVKTSKDDLIKMKDDIKKEVAGRKEEFDQHMKDECFKRMHKKIFTGISGKFEDKKLKFDNQKFERKLKHNDITNKLKALIEKLKEDVDKRMDKLNIKFDTKSDEDEVRDLNLGSSSSSN